MRASDIVKGSRPSPERALLSNQTTPMHHRPSAAADSGSIYTENIDLSSPGFNERSSEPPRNIFDDI